MSRLVAAFASSHSVMLTCTLHDWQNGFKVHDLKGRYFDRKGNFMFL
jgi:3-O-methylgallate 3,4-dioxygenase